LNGAALNHQSRLHGRDQCDDCRGLGCSILDLIVVHNAAAGQLSLGVGAGMPEMVIANDSSQHFFYVGDQNADMRAVDAKPQGYILLFQLPA
jgi:hypothetical protein